MKKTRSTSVLRFAISGEQWTVTDCHHNLASFIREGLQPQPSITRSLHAFARRKENADASWQEIVENFCGHRELGRGFWVNTGFGPSLLAPTSLYYQIDALIILQAHSGGAGRIGYLKPKVYRDPDKWFDRSAWGVVSAKPLNSPAWITDDAGDTWQARGEYQDLTNYAGTTDPNERGRGKLFVANDGRGFCPLSGGELALDFFHGDPNSVPCWR